MNSSIYNLFVMTLCVCLSVRHAASVKCYECKTNLLDGTAEARCKDKLGNVMTRECLTSACSIVINNQENGEGFITRSCGEDTNGTLIGGEVNSGEDHGQYTANGSHVTWSICTTDLCNWDITHKHRIRRQISDFFNLENIPSFGLHDPTDYVSKDKKIQCYQCSTNPFDETDTMCRLNMKPQDCYGTSCSIFKMTFAGDQVIYRRCGGTGLAGVLPQKKDPKNDKITRFGVDFAWSTCTTDLCNWGVMNKYQMMTLYVSVILSLSVSCRFF